MNHTGDNSELLFSIQGNIHEHPAMKLAIQLYAAYCASIGKPQCREKFRLVVNDLLVLTASGVISERHKNDGLRDELAKAAMIEKIGLKAWEDKDELAMGCYALADAMIQARELPK